MNGIRLNGKKRVVVLILSLLALALLALRIGYHYRYGDTMLHFVTELLPALAVVLFAAAKSGYCNVFALVIPLVFVRPVLTIGEFFRKSGDQK